ncbi:head-tail connector protein [Micromonospora humidisoli]|uniref:Phage gp6-like head-tail connector protein n=1 Tax=Micromonospora humidisoli TaxID=2807622 RepID=A0ABS2JBP5_9ACTN|nr:head-tail connector protein [Micromonospora humidisoli]MBM7083606.1 phage gp6-like head-tail connector protein [Micromonospora humidisoli]
MATYVDLTTFKEYLGVTDNSRDTLLDQALQTASRHVDKITGRSFTAADSPSARVYRTHGRVVPGDVDGDGLLVDDIADVTGLTVDTGAGGTWTAYTGWTADPAGPGLPVSVLRGRWWTTAVRVTALWGWPVVPDEVRQATLLQAARLHKRRGSPEGIAGSAEWGAVRVSRTDPDVEALVSPYVLPAFA